VLVEETFRKLKALRLSVMAKAFEEQLQDPEFSKLSFEDRLGLIVDREWTERENRRLRRRLTEARFRFQARIEEIDYRKRKGLEKALISELSTCEWIKRHLNLLIVGPTGIGKTFLACALGTRACQLGFRVLFYRTPRLFSELLRCDGSYLKLLSRLKRVELLVIDDRGASTLTDTERRDFLEIVEDRYELSSTMICSQVPIKNSYSVIGEPTIADSILDRLVHRAYRIELKGESMRKQKGSNEL